MPRAFEDFLLWDWSDLAYRHIKDDPARDVLDFSHAALASDNRWNHAGEPSIYLADDPSTAMAEYARHLRLDRNPLRAPPEAARRIYELQVHDVEPLLDLRDPGLCAALHLHDDHWFYDMRRSRAVAAYLRHTTEAKGLLTSPMAFPDKPDAWNLVLFLDKLPSNPRSFLTVHGYNLEFGFEQGAVLLRDDSPGSGGEGNGVSSNIIYEAGSFKADKLDDVTAAMKAVNDSVDRMNVAIDQRKTEWRHDPEQLQTTEAILESVAAHVADDAIRALEMIETEFTTFEERIKALEVVFNSCFGATPAAGTWDPAGPQTIRDSVAGLRNELVRLTSNTLEQSIQAESDSRDLSDPHFARSAATAARVKNLISEIAGRTTLRLRTHLETIGLVPPIAETRRTAPPPVSNDIGDKRFQDKLLGAWWLG